MRFGIDSAATETSGFDLRYCGALLGLCTPCPASHWQSLQLEPGYGPIPLSNIPERLLGQSCKTALMFNLGHA